MKLFYIVLVPTMFINIIALLKAIKNDIYFNLGWNLLYRLEIGEIVYYIKQLGCYWVLMYKEFIDSLNLT